MLTHEQIQEILAYDPVTGVLKWKTSRGRVSAGSIAGYDRPDGYRSIGIDGELYLSHRVIWFHVHGQWPSEEIDHINRNRSDNRLENLRAATKTQNQANRSATRTNRVGLKGVSYRADRSRWQATIRQNNQNIYLGMYKSAYEAHAAYVCAANKYFGEFARSA